MGGYPANRRRASVVNQFTPALNNIMGNGGKKKMPMSSPKKKPVFKQFGDKGYTPSNGKGVGF